MKWIAIYHAEVDYLIYRKLLKKYMYFSVIPNVPFV